MKKRRTSKPASDDRRIDGNAAAGMLSEIFVSDVTVASGATAISMGASK